jgi:hypothetical protein
MIYVEHGDSIRYRTTSSIYSKGFTRTRQRWYMRECQNGVVQGGIGRTATERLREFQTRRVSLPDSRVWKLWMISKSTDGTVAVKDESLAESASANPNEKSVNLCLIACSSFFFQFGKNPRVESLDKRMISTSQSSCSFSLKAGSSGHHLISMSGLKSSGRSRPSFLATFLICSSTAFSSASKSPSKDLAISHFSLDGLSRNVSTLSRMLKHMCQRQPFAISLNLSKLREPDVVKTEPTMLESSDEDMFSPEMQRLGLR